MLTLSASSSHIGDGTTKRATPTAPSSTASPTATEG